MKALKLIAWISGIIAVIIMILGVIDFFFSWELFTVNKAVNYFSTANSFLLLAICCTLYYSACVCKEDKKK
jgi:amino acid transporter